MDAIWSRGPTDGAGFCRPVQRLLICARAAANRSAATARTNAAPGIAEEALPESFREFVKPLTEESVPEEVRTTVRIPRDPVQYLDDQGFDENLQPGKRGPGEPDPVVEQRRSFFQEKLDHINLAYDSKAILQEARSFKAADGYRLFCDRILKGYLLALAQQDLVVGLEHQSLTNAVVEAARRLENKEFTEAIERITGYYDQNVFKASELQKDMLAIKDVLLARGIYAFMFKVINDNIPYIFMIPADIKRSFTMEDVFGGKTGLIKRFREQPLTFYLVDGTDYPDRWKAAFFEGRHAVIFDMPPPAGVSAQNWVDWRAQHEFMHAWVQHVFKTTGDAGPVNI